MIMVCGLGVSLEMVAKILFKSFMTVDRNRSFFKCVFLYVFVCPYVSENFSAQTKSLMRESTQHSPLHIMQSKHQTLLMALTELDWTYL